MDCMLYKAARKGDVEFLKQFIQSDNHNHLLLHTNQENNILHIAAKLGHEPFIHEALQTSPFLASHINSKGDTPLHVAARAGHIAVVKLLLKDKIRRDVFRVDSTETPGTTVLREMEEGQSGVPKLWRMKNKVQSFALHEALRNGHEDVALYLWELDREMAGVVTSLERVDLLRDAVRGPDGQNPLHAAVLAGSTECIGYLLEDEDILKLINQPDVAGKTALHFATAARDTNIIRELLKRSTSSAYLRDRNGRTPLLEAASSGNFDVFQGMLQHCPDTIELCDPTGQNALHLAVLNNTTQNVRKFLHLLEMKELVNEPDEEGSTPLHLAVKNENYKLVRKLMETKCADLRTKNNRGLTALDICESDWNLSYRQNSLHTFLRRQNAPPANTMSVVAALLATLTFAAAFTLPGGYHADDKEIQQYSTNDKNKTPVGSSILIKKLSLTVFVLADSVAMCCSMTVVFLLTLAMAGDPAFLRSAIIYSRNLLNIALLGTLVAFITGLYTVISPKSIWLAIIVIIMGSSVPFLIKLLRRKSSTSSPLVIKYLKGTVKKPVISYSPGRGRSNLNISYGYSQTKSPRWY
ncbi:hypothetical protein Pint_03941 [Pistacia integerrima]|uniref:Uncharacterized protein n=1 Tax=Pistacia integerrima TaxID=434235 RepID=A0ACC0Z4Z6_9ROSI|nr:hypothetical protein Pint_03941 [Pistacia integerrima]